MDQKFTRPFRASIVARARFIEDLIVERPVVVGSICRLDAGVFWGMVDAASGRGRLTGLFTEKGCGEA
jgi:hypothetical protein